MDTQWPRYEVFKQDKDGKPHEAVGSVHAPDGEMALLNARDVFVRRPSAVSLWVVPDSAIYSVTAEELAAGIALPEAGETQSFLVFTKRSQRRSMTFVKHVGEVTAVTPQHALQQAITHEEFEPDKVWVWWIVPATAVTRSDDDEATIASMFTPAHDKTYRQQAHYGFVSPTRKTRGKSER